MSTKKEIEQTQRLRALIKEAGGKCKECGGVFHEKCYVWDTERVVIVNNLDKPLKLLREWTKDVDMVCANCYITRHADK